MANEAALLEQEPPEIIDAGASAPAAAPADATEPAEPVSLRDALEEAFDKNEKSGEPAAPVAAGAAEPKKEEGGSAAAKPTEPKVEGTPPPAAQGAAPAGELKAPAQWKPAVREKWNTLPREVQEEVLRREADSMRLIGSVGPKIRLADEVNTHLQPYLEKLQANNVSPSAFIGDLFSSVKSLTSGNPQEKAEVIANIVQSYGVDLRVLDALLSQRLQAGPEALQARRLAAQAQAVLQQNQGNLEHQSELEAEKTIAAFGADPKHEFLDDVRDLMADLIEAGRATTLDEAYAAAIWAHPDTRKILLQREATSRAAAKGGRAAAARKASAAVHGTPSGSAGPVIKPNASVREALEQAFDDHSSL